MMWSRNCVLMWSGDPMIVWFFWSRDYAIFWSCDCVIQTNLSNCLNLKHHSECFKLAKLVSIFHIFCIQSLLRCWNLLPYCYFIKNCIPATVVKNIRFPRLVILTWRAFRYFIRVQSAYRLLRLNSKDFFLRIKGVSVYKNRYFLQVPVSKNFISIFNFQILNRLRYLCRNFCPQAMGVKN